MTPALSTVKKRLLLLGWSSMSGAFPLPTIKYFLSRQVGFQVKRAVFISQAQQSIYSAEYANIAQAAFETLGIDLRNIEDFQCPEGGLASADVLVIGGADGVNLLSRLEASNLTTSIRKHVAAGKPYIGWAGGAEIAGHSIFEGALRHDDAAHRLDALKLLPFDIATRGAWDSYASPSNSSLLVMPQDATLIAESGLYIYCARHCGTLLRRDCPPTHIRSNTAINNLVAAP